MMESYDQKADARLRICANINVVIFLMFGVVFFFKLLPIIFLIVAFTTALFNFGLVVIFMKDLKQHKDLLKKYKRQRNRYLRILIISVSWMTLFAVIFIIG